MTEREVKSRVGWPVVTMAGVAAYRWGGVHYNQDRRVDWVHGPALIANGFVLVHQEQTRAQILRNLGPPDKALDDRLVWLRHGISIQFDGEKIIHLYLGLPFDQAQPIQ